MDIFSRSPARSFGHGLTTLGQLPVTVVLNECTRCMREPHRLGRLDDLLKLADMTDEQREETALQAALAAYQSLRTQALLLASGCSPEECDEMQRAIGDGELEHPLLLRTGQHDSDALDPPWLSRDDREEIRSRTNAAVLDPSLLAELDALMEQKGYAAAARARSLADTVCSIAESWALRARLKAARESLGTALEKIGIKLPDPPKRDQRTNPNVS